MSGVLLWFAVLCACALFGWANYRRNRAMARRLLDLRLSEPRIERAGDANPASSPKPPAQVSPLIHVPSASATQVPPRTQAPSATRTP